MESCCWKRCKREAALTWLERDLCGEHWDEVCRLRDEGQTAETIRERHTVARVAAE